MPKIKSATRIALSIGVGCASLIWVASSLGLIPNPIEQTRLNRIRTTKTLAVNVSTFAENQTKTDLRKILDRVVAVDDELISVGVRRNGKRSYVFTAGPHLSTWKTEAENDPSEQIEAQILANGREWGQLHVTFKPIEGTGDWMSLTFPLGLILFLSSAMALLSWVVLGKSLKYLNPSSVVPNRVRSALDSLAEGLVLVDATGEIAHANSAFRSIATNEGEEILGKRLDDFGWLHLDETFRFEMPWVECLNNESQITGQVIQLKVPNAPTRKFAVNATPIFNGENAVRGALVSFDDVTAVENKNAELSKIIGTLRSSLDEVARQNEKLNFLASYDPLTKCMNRRAFFGEFEKYWADVECTELNLMMLDVDHFKSVNDNHGHSVGDAVLKEMGKMLRERIGEQGLVCRYGGEEFVVLIPNLNVDDCVDLANDVRKLIERTVTCGISYTASIGVSSRDFKPMDPQHMLDQADECLYTAKRNGRNQVVRFDERDSYEGAEEGANTTSQADNENVIPYSAVTGLLSALSFRCQQTAEHSIRVADLSVAVGEKLMNKRELYRLEIAALLHDIGKIGVPDAILHKPGPLTPDEWKVMRKHDDIGGEIVRNALASDTIANSIESHHFCSSLRSMSVPRPEVLPSIPLASRIITACDAYDAMTNDRVYRAAMTVEDALAELKRNTPEQFDPSVIEILSEYIRSGCYQSNVSTKQDAAPVSTRQATAIGQHIEQLYTAINEEDVEKLQTVVQQLCLDSSEGSEISQVAARLDVAIGTSEKDLDEVLALANEVMQICRKSRTTFVDAAESIVSPEKLIGELGS